MLNATSVPYYLDEHNHWGTSLDTIKEAYTTAKNNGTDVRAIVIINPGNPTGASLTEDEVKSVVKFAAEEKLVQACVADLKKNIEKGIAFVAANPGGKK